MYQCGGNPWCMYPAGQLYCVPWCTPSPPEKDSALRESRILRAKQRLAEESYFGPTSVASYSSKRRTTSKHTKNNSETSSEIVESIASNKNVAKKKRLEDKSLKNSRAAPKILVNSESDDDTHRDIKIRRGSSIANKGSQLGTGFLSTAASTGFDKDEYVQEIRKIHRKSMNQYFESVGSKNFDQASKHHDSPPKLRIADDIYQIPSGLAARGEATASALPGRYLRKATSPDSYPHHRRKEFSRMYKTPSNGRDRFRMGFRELGDSEVQFKSDQDLPFPAEFASSRNLEVAPDEHTSSPPIFHDSRMKIHSAMRRFVAGMGLDTEDNRQSENQTEENCKKMKLESPIPILVVPTEELSQFVFKKLFGNPSFQHSRNFDETKQNKTFKDEIIETDNIESNKAEVAIQSNLLEDSSQTCKFGELVTDFLATSRNPSYEVLSDLTRLLVSGGRQDIAELIKRLASELSKSRTDGIQLEDKPLFEKIVDFLSRSELCFLHSTSDKTQPRVKTTQSRTTIPNLENKIEAILPNIQKILTLSTPILRSQKTESSRTNLHDTGPEVANCPIASEVRCLAEHKFENSPVTLHAPRFIHRARAEMLAPSSISKVIRQYLEALERQKSSFTPDKFRLYSGKLEELLGVVSQLEVSMHLANRDTKHSFRVE